MTPTPASSFRYLTRGDEWISQRLLRVCFLSLIATVFFLTSPAKALLDQLADLGLSFDFPDGWSSSVANGHYYLNNGDSSKLVTIIQTAEDPMPPMDAPGTDLKIAQSSTAGPFTALGHQTLGGVDFIVYDAQQLDPQHRGILYSRIYYTEANGYGIAISTTTLNGVLPQNDPEIMHIINSIAFVGTPQLPASSNGSPGSAIQNNAVPNTNQMGSKSALVVGVIALAVAGGFIAGVIALVVWLVFQRKKTPKSPPI